MWWQSFEKCHFFPVFVEYTTGGYLSASTRPATRHPRLDKSTGGIGTSQVASKLEIDSVPTVWVSTLCCFGLQTLPRVLPRRRVKPTTKSIKTGMDWHSTWTSQPIAQNTSPRKLAMDAMALAKELFPQIEVQAKKHCGTKDWRNSRNFSKRSRIVCTVQSFTTKMSLAFFSKTFFCNPCTISVWNPQASLRYMLDLTGHVPTKTNLHHSFTFRFGPLYWIGPTTC